MSRRDFENAEESGKYTYDPGKRNVKPNKDVPETLKAYYGPTLTPAVVEEIKAWAEVLNAIKDGIPKPYDTSVIVSKIQKLERDTGKDFSELKIAVLRRQTLGKQKRLNLIYSRYWIVL
jgi:hypothetical protein